MLAQRVIPCLLLQDENLVKTVRFGNARYVGDPCNTARIFNELEVDELLLLDISAARRERGPCLPVLRSLAQECFMPLAYGGGISTLEQAHAVFDAGIEKIAVNTAAIAGPELVESLAARFGSQAVIGSVDVRKVFGLGYRVYARSGGSRTRLDPVAWARELEHRGAGEILLTSIDREGTWAGPDLDLCRRVLEAVRIPVICHGGVGSVAHIVETLALSPAAAVAVGSLVVFQKKGMGVLVSFPELRKA